VPGNRLSAHRYAAEAKPSVSPTGLYGNDADDKPYSRYVHCSSVLFAVLWGSVLLRVAQVVCPCVLNTPPLA
jgi:hypothetical protein